MCAAASRVHRKAERRFSRMMKSQSSALASQIWPDVPPPTSFTRMSSRPCVLKISANSAFTGASSVTSAVIAITRCPVALICRSVSARPAASTSASTSEAPSSLSRSAMARPIPAAAPVTSAILPATLSPKMSSDSPPEPLLDWQVRPACCMASIGQDENGPVDRMVETKTAIVTGGAGGIGKATVRRLLDSGLAIFVIDANQGALDALRSEFAHSADRLDVCRADVTDERQTIDAVARAQERFGGIYALVHIAGGAGPKRARDIEEFQLQDWSHVIDLNLTSAFLAARAVVPLMRPRRAGRVVLFSSIIADGEKGPLTTVTGRLPYATAKAALLGFTSQLAKDLAEWSITVNALMPGLILGEQGTRIRDRFDRLEPEQRAAMLARYPGGKPGSGDDVAAVVDFLLSESAGFISGVALPVDGAYR